MTVEKLSFTHAIFDFDGVVADTETVFAEFDRALLNETLEEAGIKQRLSFKDVRALAGNPGPDKLGIIAERLGFDAKPYQDGFNKRRDERRPALFKTHETPLGKNLKNFTQSMQGRIALATNKSAAKLTPDLKTMELENIFDIIVTCDPPLKKKPAPDILLAAAKQLGAAPETCIYIGDNTLDMQAAMAANMTPIGFIIEGLEGHKMRKDALLKHGAKIVIDDFTHLQNQIYTHYADL